MNKRRKTLQSSQDTVFEEAVKDKNFILPESEPNKHANGDSLSSYERIRIENIKRNTDFLENLGLDAVKPDIDDIKSNRKVSSRGVRKEYKVTIPTRRSSRVTTEKIKAELEEAKKTGNSSLVDAKEVELQELLNKKEIPFMATQEVTMEAEYERLPKDPILLLPVDSSDSIHDNGITDNNQTSNTERQIEIPLIQTLLSMKSLNSSDTSHVRVTGSNVDNKNTNAHANAHVNYVKKLKSFNVKEDEVAKLTKDRIVSVFVHPYVDKLIVAAGDKSGHLGLWDVHDTVGGNDGVYTYKPHVSKVLAIHCWSSEYQKIWSISSDGTLRYLDANQQAFVQGFEAPESIHDLYFSDACFSSDDPTILVGKSDGHVALIDPRASSSAYSWQFEVQPSKVNSCQFIPHQSHLIVTAGSGQKGVISIHDIRHIRPKARMQAIYSYNDHKKSINAAIASPDGQFLVSVSQDNTIKCRHNFTSSSSCLTSIGHDNHTGRWLSTFKPTFDPKCNSTFVIGSMERPRRIEFFTATASANTNGASNEVSLRRDALVSAEFLQSVCSRNACHPSLDIIAGGNSSGRVHIIR